MADTITGNTVDNESKFNYHKLTDDEVLSGSIFTVSNLKLMQNLISDYAHEQLNVEYLDDKPTAAIKQVAYCKGAIEALRHLIDSHNAVTEELSNSV